MKTRSSRPAMFGIVTLAVLLAAAVQQASAQSAGDTALEEITVTAQRRVQNLQDVPATVTAFGAEEVREAGLQKVDDFARRTPGLSMDAFPATQPRLAIRGIGSFDKGAAGDPSSAVFIDEVYLGRPAAVAFDAFDVERVEVLKGPQGTLYGRNVVGGAINVVTARPGMDSFDASLEATYGNYNRQDLAGFVNAPLGDAFALRASGAIRRRDGFVESNYSGDELDNRDTQSGRLQALFLPTENLEISLAADYSDDDANGPAQYVLDLDEGDPLSAFWTLGRDRDDNSSEIAGHQKRKTSGLRGQLVWDMPFATLNYLVSQRELEYDAYYDFDGGSPEQNAVSIAGGNAEDSEMSSQELRLSAPASSGVSWLVGLYQYSADTRRWDILDLGIAGPSARDIFDQDAKLDSYAAYGDITYPLSESLNLTAGLRYTEDKKYYRVWTTGSEAHFRSEEAYDAQASENWDAVTWRLGADYHFQPGQMLYLMVSRGFKSGGFQDNPENAQQAVDSYDPEFAIQYELGQRGTFFDGSLVWNNSIYRMDYTDLQTRQATGLSITTSNAGAATIRGYETELNWLMGSGFSIDFSYAYTDAKFDSFFENENDYSGNQLSRSPKHKAVISGSYDYTLASGDNLRFVLDHQYTGRIYDDNSNLAPELRDPTTFVDGRIVYGFNSIGLSLSLWGRNLTDEKSRTFQSVFLGANFGAFTPPRTYGLTILWDHL